MNTMLFFSLSVMIPAQAPAALHVKNAIVDRGDVKAGPALTQNFTLRNQGRQPLTIRDVAVACGCLKPKLSRREVPPGETAELTIDVNTLSQPAGPNRWTTTVRYLHGSDSGELELQIIANLIREVSLEPVALGLTIDKETTHTFTLTDRRAKPLTITAVSCTSNQIKTAIMPVSRNAAGERTQQVLVTVLDTFPAGHFTEVLQIVTDDADYRELRAPIQVHRRAPGQLTATPDQVDLRLAKGQKAASGLVRLRDADGRQVVVERLEADHPALRHKWTPGPDSMATLRLGVEINGQPASGHGNVTVHIKEPKPQVLVIPVSWRD